MYKRASMTSQMMWGPGSAVVSSMGRTIFQEEGRDENSLISPEEEESNQQSLPYFPASLFATILEDAMVQLRVLSACNTELRLCKTKMDMNQLLANKYHVEQPVVVDELSEIDPRKLGCMEYKLNKLDADSFHLRLIAPYLVDRKYLSDVFTSSYKDLTLERSYSALFDSIKVIVERDEYRNTLRRDEYDNKIQRRDLNRQLRQQRNHIKSVTYEYETVVDKLKKQVEDAEVVAATRSRYVDSWQRARTEQHIQTIQDKESPPTENIEFYKQRTDHEQRVHTEVELLINIAINETLGKVESWMNKYDKDMEAIDLKIQIKKSEYQNQTEIREELEETIEKHDILMKKWIHFKDEREKARLYREKMNNAAVCVQAWWRGLLVRLELGPYKVVKRKGGKPPGGKKK